MCNSSVAQQPVCTACIGSTTHTRVICNHTREHNAGICHLADQHGTQVHRAPHQVAFELLCEWELGRSSLWWHRVLIFSRATGGRLLLMFADKHTTAGSPDQPGQLGLMVYLELDLQHNSKHAQKQRHLINHKFFLKTI